MLNLGPLKNVMVFAIFMHFFVKKKYQNTFSMLLSWKYYWSGFNRKRKDMKKYLKQEILHFLKFSMADKIIIAQR